MACRRSHKLCLSKECEFITTVLQGNKLPGETVTPIQAEDSLIGVKEKGHNISKSQALKDLLMLYW